MEEAGWVKTQGEKAQMFQEKVPVKSIWRPDHGKLSLSGQKVRTFLCRKRE